jgi:alkaline phosphatase
MSGAEVPLVVGLISGIISIVDATKKVYDAVKDKDRLPVAFREVAIRLPIVYDTLEATGKYIEKHPADGCLIENLIKSCDTRAKLLRDIFEKVAAPEKGKDSRADRYLKAVRVMGKGARVESLVKGILEDLQLLVGNHLVHVTSDEQNQALAASIKDVSDIEPSIPDEALSETSNSFYQSGGGNMFNTFGGKNQYYLGGGNQFQGQNLYFGEAFQKK